MCVPSCHRNLYNTKRNRSSLFKKSNLLCLWNVYSVISLCIFFLVKDERINQNIMRPLRKYANQEQDDWDVHLQAIIYGINTTKHVGVFLFLIETTNLQHIFSRKVFVGGI